MIIFTQHALERIKDRKIRYNDVIETINNPDKILRHKNKHKFQKKLINGKIEIVSIISENNIKIITIYWI